jgi:hypothetical protein
VLLRLGLAALVDHARGPDGSSASLDLRAVLEGGRVRISVGLEPAGEARRGGDAELDLVRRIAELHGGTLTLPAADAAGARYTLSLIPA